VIRLPASNSKRDLRNTRPLAPAKTDSAAKRPKTGTTLPSRTSRDNIFSRLRSRTASPTRSAAGLGRLPLKTKPSTTPRTTLPSFVERNGAIRSPKGKVASAADRLNFADRLASGKLRGLADTRIGRKLDFQRQFEMSRRGDVARRLNLSRALDSHGGWHSRHHHGHVHSSFIDIHFGSHYAGPSCYPTHTWMPHWSPWVSWSWWDHCQPVFDPRPSFCRPVVCRPCDPWVAWHCPVWIDLSVVSCGTWIDVAVVRVNDRDLQLLAVRFVDSGHPEQKLGPRYRVWFRNNSDRKLGKDFNITLLASNTRELSANMPNAGVEIDKIDAGAILTADIRLPFEANTLDRDAENRAVPFRYLHVLVDSHQDVDEVFEENNGAILARGDVLPVDPASFSTNVTSAEPGAMIDIAGEGFGPEPGEVIIQINGLELQAEIYGWYDLGVHIKLPALPLAAETQADIVIVRGDGAVSNPVQILVVPAKRPLTPPPAPVQ
jgi:hypothetical protein